jgi:hypothetical protein
MLFASLFPLAGRGKSRCEPAPGRETPEHSLPNVDSVRVTASALRAWAEGTDADGQSPETVGS